MNSLKAALPLIVAGLVYGCDSSDSTAQAASASPPAWVDTPVYQDGLAATACVPASGNQQQDASRADLQARQQLARRISDHLGATRVTQSEDEQMIRTQVDQVLTGSRRLQGEYVEITGKKHFCSMLVINEESIPHGTETNPGETNDE